jgi:hypothetical protein
MTRILFAILCPCALALALYTGCTFAPSNARIGIDAPSFEQFTANDGTMPLTSAADFFDHRCGSLDCHGNPQRNLQFWGCDGQRLPVDAGPGVDAAVYPGCRASGGVNTTPAEYEASYRSLVGLEPTVMSAVVQAGPKGNPDLLTFVRKARGEESHKGGMLVTPGDDQDICMTAWLTGPSNTAACASAIATTP